MADTKGGLFAKTVQKHAGRAKEKILQNLGKADRTVDEVFDEFEGNFTQQQTNANRLHKEVANYLRCCRALHGASKGLYDTLSEVYEPDWVGHELLYAQAQNSDMLWTDLCHKLQDQTLAPLTAYQQQFPDIRKKIDKRGRKLVDYDSQRHQLENLQRATRRDEYKIARSRDALETARVTYEALNKELYDELPTLYDQRIPNIAAHLQTLFAAQTTFMAESSKVAKELEAIAEKLSKECAKGTYKVKRSAAPRPLSSIESSPQNANSPMWYDGGSNEDPDYPSSPTNEGSTAILEISSSDDHPQPVLHQSYKSLPDPDRRTPTPPASLPLQEASEPDPPSSPTADEDNITTTAEPDTNNRPTISAPVTHKEETGRPYEEIEFEDKKVNGSVSSPARTNGEVIGTKIPAGSGGEEVDGSGSCAARQEGQWGVVEAVGQEAGGGGGVQAGDSPASRPPPAAPAPSSSPPCTPSNAAHSVSPAAGPPVTSNGPALASTQLDKKVEEIYDIPVGATTEGLPPGILYRVRATYKYTREDVDEISFEVGDIMQVVEYEDPEEQEEGWLTGIKEGTTEKGLFPANFTRPI